MLLALLPLALAQDVCPVGQQAPPNAADQCCWPAQVWDRQESACLGTPTCPEGTRVYGSDCVAVDPTTEDTPSYAPLHPDAPVDGPKDPQGIPTGGGLGTAPPPEAPSPSLADPIILGALSKDHIEAVIRENKGDLRYCYAKGLKEIIGLEGKVVVKFVVAKDGTVSSATTKSSTLGAPEVEACLNAAFMRFQFDAPKGGGIVIVSYPLIFAPE